MTADDGGAVAVVMAAGRSTRMKSDLPKVLHPLCGQPLLAHVLDAFTAAGVARVILVVGYREDLVRAAFADRPGVEFVTQTEQRGTGHAVRCAAPLLANHRGPVVVLAGDQPLLRAELVTGMIDGRAKTGAAAFMATAEVADPTGLGRILRDADGGFLRIVEHKDATPEQRRNREVNASFYCFDGPKLFAALDKVGTDNAQGEYYLTDVPAILAAEGGRVVAEPIATEIDAYGVNDRRQLAQVHAALQQRIAERHMADGVTIVDPRNTYIDARATIGRETLIEPFTVISGRVRIGERCLIGPFAHLLDGSEVGDDAVVGSNAVAATTRGS